mmetsp:Transcript_32099/g.89424  ORF Transcript_32099/g.89424 Transcript_32099/m.89424 type:complete len:249 (+) Transcript_32099:2-748(+)
MLRQDEAIKGLTEEQANIMTKEQRLEHSVESLLAVGRSGSWETPHLVVPGGLPEPPPVQQSMIGIVIGAGIHIIGTMIWSYIYGVCFTYAYPPLRNPPPAPSREHFTFGLFHGCSCDPDWRICCCSCCCGGIRWADSMGSEKVRFMSFWPAVLLFAVLQYLAGLTGVACLALLALGVLGRQRLREVYDLPHGDCQTCWQDCLIWLCCGPCAIMQEASQVEFVELPSIQGKDAVWGSPTQAMPDTIIMR